MNMQRGCETSFATNQLVSADEGFYSRFKTAMLL